MKHHRTTGLVLAIGLLLSAAGGNVGAHMSATPIGFWGPFAAETVSCLRRMSQVTHSCFATVLALETGCREALLRGESCDRDQVERDTDAATREMRIAVVEACTEGQLTEVGYFGFADANIDLLNACVTQPQAAVAALYAPASSDAPACLSASAVYGSKAMLYMLERQTPVLERITARLFTPAQKTQSILRMRLELSETRQRWIAGLLAVCPQFADVYGRTPESLLRTLGQRIDCLLSKTYVNSAVSCLAQVCGNGIPEPNEECDDGNADDGDACRNDCKVNG